MLTGLAGRAIRLIFELGLHRDSSDLESSPLTPMDSEVRQVVFWGCFNFDRYKCCRLLWVQILNCDQDVGSVLGSPLFDQA